MLLMTSIGFHPSTNFQMQRKQRVFPRLDFPFARYTSRIDCTCTIHPCVQSSNQSRPTATAVIVQGPSSHVLYRRPVILKFGSFLFLLHDCLLCQLNGNLVTRQETLFFRFFCRQGSCCCCCGCCCRCMWSYSGTNGNESNPVNCQPHIFRFGTMEFTHLRANTQDIVTLLGQK